MRNVLCSREGHKLTVWSSNLPCTRMKPRFKLHRKHPVCITSTSRLNVQRIWKSLFLVQIVRTGKMGTFLTLIFAVRIVTAVVWRVRTGVPKQNTWEDIWAESWIDWSVWDVSEDEREFGRPSDVVESVVGAASAWKCAWHGVVNSYRLLVGDFLVGVHCKGWWGDGWLT
jgi:hypothetical protein